MPLYVIDPENPGKHVNVVELLKRNPTRPPPPGDVLSLMQRDKWTRHEALLILAGYSPRNVVDNAGDPIGAAGAGVVYLDGTTDTMLSAAGLQHPLRLNSEILENYWTLTGYARGEPEDERRTPAEWLAWAESRRFTPYWLGHWRTYQEAQELAAASEFVYNGALINWDYWTKKMPRLNRVQASRLMSCLDPDIFADISPDTANEQCIRARNLARLADADGVDDLKPYEWFEWAMRNEQPVHMSFRVAIMEYAPSPDETRQAETITKLQREARSLHDQQEIAKAAAGRYTLDEAADVIAQNTGEREGTLKAKLAQAAIDEILPVYLPGENARYRPKTVRGFNEEAYWDDLNAWLEENEPRIDWRFPAPNHAETGQQETHLEPTSQKTTAERQQPKAASEWAVSARVICQELLGADPNRSKLSIDRLAEMVRDEMERRHQDGAQGMTNRSQNIPAATSIKRHALTGIKNPG